MLLESLATKEDLIRLEAKMLDKMGNMAWKMAGLLILQAGVNRGSYKADLESPGS